MNRSDQNERLGEVLAALDATLEAEHRYFRQRSVIIPSRKEIVKIVKTFQQLMFPDYFSIDEHIGKTRAQIIADLFEALKRQISAAYSFSDCTEAVDTETIYGTIVDIRSATIDGNTIFYLSLNHNLAVYYTVIAKDYPTAVILNVGDLVKLEYVPVENAPLMEIVTLEMK